MDELIRIYLGVLVKRLGGQVEITPADLEELRPSAYINQKRAPDGLGIVLTLVQDRPQDATLQ